MQLVLLVVHLMIGLAMVGVILLQRNEGGGLSGLGGGSTMGGFLGARGAANLLTHMTAIFAGLFMLTSLLLTVMAGHTLKKPSILDEVSQQNSAISLPIQEEKLAPPETAKH